MCFRYITSLIPDGVRWSHDDSKFIFKEEFQKGDSESHFVDKKKTTSRELCKAMNSIFPNINFTVENEEDFENRRLPTLDCELWMEKSGSGNFIMYSFY